MTFIFSVICSACVTIKIVYTESTRSLNLKVALLGALAWQLKLSERTRCSALFAGLLCSWGIVGVHSYHGNLCLVACFTAYLARIYELGMR
jgi:hypothetical protein